MNNTMCLLPIGVSTLVLALFARALPARDYIIENDAMTRVVSVDTTVATATLTIGSTSYDSNFLTDTKLDETIRMAEDPGTAFELWQVDISPYKETRYKPGTFSYGDTFEVSMPRSTTPLIIRLKPAAK